MTGFPAPVVASCGSNDPAAPLVVLLHGRGSDERDIIGLADHLPAGPAYAAVRAPIAEGSGFRPTLAPWPGTSTSTRSTPSRAPSRRSWRCCATTR